MKRLKIQVSGNSVAMRVRPAEKFPKNHNYTHILQNLLDNALENTTIQVDNLAFGGALVRDAIYSIDSLINTYPRYYILNFGVNDASTREIPHWFNKLVNTPVKSRLEYICSGIHAHIFKKYRPFFVKLRGCKSWVSEKEFIEQYTILLSSLIKDTNARIISLSINPANNRVEKQLPGSKLKYISYNEIIKNITTKYNQIYVDTSSLVTYTEYPDGIHYSYEGHKLIASKLKEIILADIATS